MAWNPTRPDQLAREAAAKAAREAKRAANRAAHRNPFNLHKMTDTSLPGSGSPDEPAVPFIQPERVRAGFLTEDVETIEMEAPAGDAFARAFFGEEPAAPAKPVTSAEALQAYGLRRICDAIIEGDPLRTIAADVGVPRSTLARWLTDNPERQAQYRAALALSAHTCDEQAFEELTAAETVPQIARAREIASHLRWRAKVRNQKDFGDKQQIDSTHTVVMTTEQKRAKLDALHERARALTSNGVQK